MNLIKKIGLNYRKFYDIINYNIFGYISKIIVIVISFLIINKFSLEIYGIYVLYTTYSIIIIKLTNFSFDKVHLIYAIKEKDKYKVYSNIIFIKILFSFIKYFFLLIFIFNIEYKLIFITIFTIFELQSYYELNSTFFDLKNKFRYKTYFNFILNSTILIWFILLVYIFKDVDLEKFLIGSLLIRLIIFYLMTKYININLNIRYINFEFIKKILLDGFNIAVILLFITLYFRIDIIMLEYFSVKIEDIGLYGALYKIFEGVIFISSQVRILFFPKFIKENNIYSLIKGLNKLLFLQIIISIIVILILLIFREPLLKYLLNFDNDIINNSKNIYYVIISVIIFSFLNDSLMSFYMSKQKYKKIQIFTFITLFLNINLNYIMIPIYSILGAAMATVLSEAILTILFFYNLKYFKSTTNDD